jgi:hypothetical protein
VSSARATAERKSLPMVKALQRKHFQPPTFPTCCNRATPKGRASHSDVSSNFQRKTPTYRIVSASADNPPDSPLGM